MCVCEGAKPRGGATRSPHPFDRDRTIALPLSQVYGVGVALAGAATIPDWPWLNRNPLHWLPAEAAGGSGDAPTTRRATTQRRLPVID